MNKKYMTAKESLVRGKRDDGKELKPGTAVFKVNGTNYPGKHMPGMLAKFRSEASLNMI